MSLRKLFRELYHGHSSRAVRFQLAVLGIDLAVIAFFIAAPIFHDTRSFFWLDYTIAALLALDMIGRGLASASYGFGHCRGAASSGVRSSRCISSNGRKRAIR